MKIKMTNPEEFNLHLDRLMKLPAHRQAYYASVTWQKRKQALALRSNGKCERCGYGRFERAHHLTYMHFGYEHLSELQALCIDCHAYLHGRSDYDPCTVRPPLQLSLF